MTRKQLERFIEIRNKSPFSSNLQFQIDAEASGFRVSDLGDAAATETGYCWRTPHGVLVEEHGELHLEKEPRM